MITSCISWIKFKRWPGHELIKEITEYYPAYTYNKSRLKDFLLKLFLWITAPLSCQLIGIMKKCQYFHCAKKHPQRIKHSIKEDQITKNQYTNIEGNGFCCKVFRKIVQHKLGVNGWVVELLNCWIVESFRCWNV